MALVISDRVKETSITTGTGTITLNGAYGGFQSFSTGVGNGNKTYYAIENETRWEVGIGTYTLSSNTLTRDTVLASSNSGDLISLSGVSTVFCTYPSDKAVFLNEDGLLDLNTFSSGVIYPGTSQFDTIIIDDSAAGDHYCPPHDTTNKLYNVSGELWWDGYAIGPTVSGWANNSFVALDALMNLKDENVSGWANQTIANTGVVISGIAAEALEMFDGGGKPVFDDVYIKEYIYHQGDTNTYIRLRADQIDFNAGGRNFLSLDEGSNDKVIINTGGHDIDFQVEGESDTNLIRTDAANDLVGIGTDSPAYKLDVVGHNAWARSSGLIVGNYGIVLANNTPSPTTNTLYNNDGVLKFNGTTVGGDSTVGIPANSASGVAISGWASQTIMNSGVAVSGWASSTMNSLDSSISGWASYAIKYHDDINISGDFNYEPYADKMFTLKRSASGNFLHAYVDDASDRTIALYSNGGSSPRWQFGLKSSPNSSVDPPSYGYIYGQDGDAGIIADTTNQVVISNTNGFFVKHQNSDVFRANSSTGVHINSSAAAYPALTVNGGVSLAADIQRWTTSAGSILSVVNKSGKFGIGKTTAAYEVDVDGSGKFDQIYFTSGIIFSDGTTQTTNATAALSGWALQTIGNSGVSVSGWTSSTFSTVADNASLSGYAEAILSSEGGYAGWKLGDGTSNLDNISSTQSVAISGLSGITTSYDINGNLLRISAASLSGWTNGTFSTNTNVNSVSGWIDNTTTTRDNAVSGWAAQTFITSDANTTYTAGSGLELVGTVFNFVDSGKILTNSASGVAISGWADATFIKTDNNTTYTAGSGLELVGTTFHFLDSGKILSNSASGVAISGWTNATFDTKSNTTAISGWALKTIGNSGVAVSGWANGTFSTNAHVSSVSGWALKTIGNSGVQVSGWANGTFSTNANVNAVSGWANSTFDTKANTAAISGYAEGIAGGGSSYSWKLTNGAVAADTISTGQTVTISGISGVEVEYTAGDNFARVSAIGLSGWTNGTFSTNANLNAVSGWALKTIGNSGVSVSGWANGTFSTNANVNNVSGWIDNTTTTRDNAVSGWANGTFITSDTNTTYTAGSGLTLVGTEFNVSSVGGSGSLEGLIVDKAIKSKINTEADGGTITFNMNDSNTHMATLGGNRTLAVSNAASGQKFILRLKQDSAGSRTVTWFNTIYWAEGGTAPTLTTTANKADVFGFLCTSGGYYDGFVIGQNI